MHHTIPRRAGKEGLWASHLLGVVLSRSASGTLPVFTRGRVDDQVITLRGMLGDPFRGKCLEVWDALNRLPGSSWHTLLVGGMNVGIAAWRDGSWPGGPWCSLQGWISCWRRQIGGASVRRLSSSNVLWALGSRKYGGRGPIKLAGQLDHLPRDEQSVLPCCPSWPWSRQGWETSMPSQRLFPS